MKGAHKEFPAEWFAGVSVPTAITCSKYNEEANKYGVKCGSDLLAWESKGWIHADAPFGWFHWYCRYFMGLRGEDDARQISRWNKCAGIKSGRWVRNLVGKVAAAGTTFDDPSVSPVVRQTLMHWAYELTERDYTTIGRQRGLLPPARGKKRERAESPPQPGAKQPRK